MNLHWDFHLVKSNDKIRLVKGVVESVFEKSSPKLLYEFNHTVSSFLILENITRCSAFNFPPTQEFSVTVSVEPTFAQRIP